MEGVGAGLVGARLVGARLVGAGRSPRFSAGSLPGVAADPGVGLNIG
jgi:hypothetical protein